MATLAIFAGLFTRSTPVGTIILAVGVIAVSLFGMVTGQFLFITDMYGNKGRVASVLCLGLGIVLLIYGIKGL